ncbi:hypothetical protein [Hansschlegelia sp.]|uniref:hypothetical protein n=1 Tax=Hansschlegelia sp. TaxID=2041892 RepID=UPI002D16763B|nr:hypothetical protein [Hansschlegelia sp.]HVI30319.1 hypothetical protein [Hansschlegelia sp.]
MIDPVESLAMNLFSRDHPDRPWSQYDAAESETQASAEERSLYRCFARAQLAERAALPRGGRIHVLHAQ